MIGLKAWVSAWGFFKKLMARGFENSCEMLGFLDGEAFWILVCLGLV